MLYFKGKGRSWLVKLYGVRCNISLYYLLNSLLSCFFVTPFYISYLLQYKINFVKFVISIEIKATSWIMKICGIVSLLTSWSLTIHTKSWKLFIIRNPINQQAIWIDDFLNHWNGKWSLLDVEWKIWMVNGGFVWMVWEGCVWMV